MDLYPEYRSNFHVSKKKSFDPLLSTMKPANPLPSPPLYPKKKPKKRRRNIKAKPKLPIHSISETLKKSVPKLVSQSRGRAAGKKEACQLCDFRALARSPHGQFQPFCAMRNSRDLPKKEKQKHPEKKEKRRKKVWMKSTPNRILPSQRSQRWKIIE